MKKSKTWETLKSGVRKNGNWYVSQYPTGWYFVYGTNSSEYGPHTTDYKTMGPFKSFDDGLKEWEKIK